MTCKYVQVNIERNQKCFSQARSHHLLCQYSSHRTTEHNASFFSVSNRQLHYVKLSKNSGAGSRAMLIGI